MTPIARTLLIIFAFIALMIGTFIWFVVSWDAAKEDSIVLLSTESQRAAAASTAPFSAQGTHL